MFKYYSYNIINQDGRIIGSRIIRILILQSPLKAMNKAIEFLECEKAVVDFKRVK